MKIINTNIKIITRKITSINQLSINTNFDSIQTSDLIDNEPSPIPIPISNEIQICVEPDIPIPIPISNKKEDDEIIKIIDTIMPRKKHKMRNLGSTDVYLKRYKPKNVSVKKMMSDVFFR